MAGRISDRISDVNLNGIVFVLTNVKGGSIFEIHADMGTGKNIVQRDHGRVNVFGLRIVENFSHFNIP